jgi:putative aldouronate transport system permease protein
VKISTEFGKAIKQWEIQTMILPGIIFLVIFAYIPMYGIIYAFKDYSIALGMTKSPWVGLQNFIEFLTDDNFFLILKNTLGINILGLIIGFPAPIIFAILINELSNQKFKRIVQTISYLPYFVSWAIFGGLVISLLSVDNGVINDLLVRLKIVGEPVAFMAEPRYFWGIAIISGLIKGIGFGSIIYLAAISSIDQEIYEASMIDGAGRLKRIWHITLPCMSGTIIIFLIFSISGILNSGFDQIYVLQNNLNVDASEVIDTYVYKIGISSLRFSYATAVGLLRSIIAVFLLLSANYFSKKITEKSLF